ncbi:MAG: hypothetical protein KF774_06540 [Planctomyces sp.]|nr:hypothetical protein [Planctomyces sp.]
MSFALNRPALTPDRTPRRERLPIVLAAVCTLAASLWATPGFAQDSPGFQSIDVGFQQRMKVGAWTEIAVTLTGAPGAEASVVVRAPDVDGNLCDMPLPHVGGVEFRGLIQTGRLDAPLIVEWREAGAVRASRTLSPAVEPDADHVRLDRHHTEYWAVLGVPVGFEAAAQLRNAEARRLQGRNAPDAAAALTLTWEALPRDVEAWESLNVIVLGGEALAIDESRNADLQQWTARGGRLILLLGDQTDRFREGLLASWVPIQALGTRNVTQLEPINALLPGTATLRTRGVREAVVGAQLAGAGVAMLGGPVVARGAYSLGTVTAFAFDLDHRPLRDWEALPQLCQFLIRSPQLTSRATEESDVSATGVTDLSSQLATTLDQFEGVRRSSFGSVLGWTLLWMVVLGPLDYLLVHKLLRRPHWTWVTLPLWVVAATALATRGAIAANTPGLVVNQLDLLDVEPRTGAVQGHSWMTFYSEENARFRISARTADGREDVKLLWNAKPEEGLRGLYRRGGMHIGVPEYRVSADRSTIEDLPVRTWSSGAVAATWRRENAPATPLVTAELRETSGERLRGTVRHHFAEPLTDWFIVFRRFAYFPDAGRGNLAAPVWAPGVDWSPQQGRQTLVDVYLTDRREIVTRTSRADKDQSVNIMTEAYNPLERNPSRLMRTLLFHEAANGSRYTTLSNYPLARLDGSRVINLEPAVLFARIRTPALTYQIDGEPVSPTESWTYVRAVLSVTPAGGTASPEPGAAAP